MTKKPAERAHVHSCKRGRICEQVSTVNSPQGTRVTDDRPHESKLAWPYSRRSRPRSSSTVVFRPYRLPEIRGVLGSLICCCSQMLRLTIHGVDGGHLLPERESKPLSSDETTLLLRHGTESVLDLTGTSCSCCLVCASSHMNLY
jgi:hypothetical protein